MKRRTAVLLAVPLAACGLAAALVAITPVPTFDATRAGFRGSDATLVDRHGLPLQRLRLDHGYRQLGWTALDDVSAATIDALIASEDRRFRIHPGVDPLAIVSAALDNTRRARPRGASTITMQLATLLAPDGAQRSTWRAKLAQVRMALALEARWTKREILEAYVNLVPFRGELRGIAAAAHGLFRKGPSGLDAAESAVLAAQLPAPRAAPSTLARRACAVLARLARPDDCDRAALVAATLPRRYTLPLDHDDAPHLARRMLTAPGETVRSSLDRAVQRFARETLREHLRSIAHRGAEDGAMVAIDNASGELLAYVGSSGELSDTPAVDGVIARRQPGSTLKPFLYALAMESRLLTAASILDDTPLAITTPVGLYVPQNYDRSFRGTVSLRTALGSSLNVPAVRTLTLVGLARFHEQLRSLGLTTLVRDAEHYGYGLALGGAEVTLLDLTNAYRAIANGGVWSAARTTPDTPSDSGRVVMDPAAAFIVADILADPAARAATFGLASPLDTTRWSAVKTGTSKAMRDNWAIGFSARYTVGVWVGNFSGEPMHDVSGVTGAAPVWRSVMDYLHAQQPSAAPAAPDGLDRLRITFAGGLEPPRDEWFLAKTGQSEIRPVARTIVPRIVSPAESAIIAVDPDIPQARQALRIETAGAPRGACLRLDDRPLGPCGPTHARLVSLPPPGTHRLTLTDSAGRELDRVGFEVRGIPRRQAATYTGTPPTSVARTLPGSS